MTFPFFIILALFLIVMQTTVLPEISIISNSFDLVIINVLYVSLLFSHPWVLGAVAVIGCIMDSLSGSPFGLYLSSYIWMYILVQLMKPVFFSRSLFFLPAVTVFSVLLEYLFLLLSVFISSGGKGVLSLNFSLMIKQLLWAALLIPVAVKLVFIVHRYWDKGCEKLFEKRRLKGSV
ncbi:MAG: rod shape-determining protein MreD [Desulfarculaceae bacterium]|nr:rod shape-determining protein MreD [Desulfarculaceae bacterium]